MTFLFFMAELSAISQALQVFKRELFPATCEYIYKNLINGIA